MVQEEVLDKVEGDRVELFAIWVPMQDGDSRDAANKATKLIGDKRVRHFWDPEKKAALAFGKMIRSAFSKTYKIPNGDHPAWDVYFVFNAKAQWREAVPVPEYWMHQLQGVDEKLMLDGGKLRELVVKFLKEAK